MFRCLLVGLAAALTVAVVGPVTTIRGRHGLLFAIALPRPANGLALGAPADRTRRSPDRSTRAS